MEPWVASNTEMEWRCSGGTLGDLVREERDRGVSITHSTTNHTTNSISDTTSPPPPAATMISTAATLSSAH